MIAGDEKSNLKLKDTVEFSKDSPASEKDRVKPDESSASVLAEPGTLKNNEPITVLEQDQAKEIVEQRQETELMISSNDANEGGTTKESNVTSAQDEEINEESEIESEGEADIHDDDLEMLLQRAEESLQNAKKPNDSQKKKKNNVKFPELDGGVSVKDELYIQTHNGVIASLHQNRVFDSDPEFSSTNQKTTNRDFPVEKMNRNRKQQLRDATTGPNWFDMPKPQMTPELKRDLQVVKLRNVLDPKRFYKKEDSKEMPKYFQVGTIVEGPTEFYSSRLTRKERRQTIVEELLADEQAKTYYKRKFSEIQESKQSGGKKYYKNLKKRQKPTWEKSF